MLVSTILMWFNRRILSFKYAFQGLKTLFQTQPNFIIHIVVALVAVTIAFFLKIPTLEWLVLILTIALVLFAEAINSALEFLTDLASPEYHPLAKKAKDVAAAAVLIMAAGSVAIGLILFLPKLLAML